MFILLVVVVTVAAVMLSTALLALRSLSRRPVTLADLDVLLRSGPDRYAHIGRILGPDDFEYLDTSPRRRHLLPALRRSRVAAMFHCLRQMREDFESLSSIGSLFAKSPTAQAERLARQLVFQRAAFLQAYWRLWLRTAVNYFVLWPLENVPLVSRIDALRAQADRILHALTPADLGAIRTSLRSG